jgi:Holliday junction resolvase RusA-like endonuclease
MAGAMTPRISRAGGHVRFNIEPRPAARPRVGKWGTYYPPIYAKYKKELGDMVECANLPTPDVCPYSVYIEFVCTPPKKLSNPFPRGDTDNYIKGVLDAINKRAIFEDDKQVQLLTGFKRYAAPGELPHIFMTWGEYSSDMDVLDQIDTISIEEISE